MSQASRKMELTLTSMETFGAESQGLFGGMLSLRAHLVPKWSCIDVNKIMWLEDHQSSGKSNSISVIYLNCWKKMVKRIKHLDA